MVLQLVASSSVLLTALSFAASVVDAAPLDRNAEAAKLITLGRRQVGDSPIGAGLIIAIIIIGIIALVGGLIGVYLKGNKARQEKFRKTFCPCIPPPKEDTNAPVYNGYGELIDPSKAAAVNPEWQVEAGATQKMSAAEAIALMETQARTGQVQAVVPGIEVPSVIALQQTTGFSTEAGTKVAQDANAAIAAVENEAATAVAKVEEVSNDAVDAVNQAMADATTSVNNAAAEVDAAVNKA